MSEWVYEDETVEDLQLNGLKLIQKKSGFRFGMDAVLLADFARIGKRDRVADFGTGTGILPLLLIGRGKGLCFDAIEIQKHMAEMTERTVKMNGLSDRVNVLQGDVKEISALFQPCSFDAIICNPPYGKPGSTLVNPDVSRAISRHQEQNTLHEFCQAAFRILKGKGKISFIYPATDMLTLITALQMSHLEPKRIRLVYPYADRPANLVLLEAVKDAKPGLHHMPPMIIYTEKDHLTNELKSVYHIPLSDKSMEFDSVKKIPEETQV